MMRRKPTALLVSNDASMIEILQEVMGSLSSLDLNVTPGAAEAHSEVARDHVALVLVHQECVGDSDQVIQLLRAIAQARRSAPTLVLSDRYSAEQALMFFRPGVADYFARPLDLSRLTYLIDVLTLRARLTRPATVPEIPSETTPIPCAVATRSVLDPPVQSMERMMEQVRRVAALDTTILLGGETGTGKTRLARLIHELSPRRDLPFLVVNCGALSATLIESEMFGHVKGAFTGADRDHIGKFAEVGRGTLLLDEIDSLPPALQAKLLRAVEERLFEPVGSNKLTPDAGPADRRQQPAAGPGGRREPVPRRPLLPPQRGRLHPAPLRERRDDHPALRHANSSPSSPPETRREVDGISVEALRAMQDHDWPGNIRELRNVIERAVALCLGREIQLEDLPEQFQSQSNP